MIILTLWTILTLQLYFDLYSNSTLPKQHTTLNFVFTGQFNPFPPRLTKTGPFVISLCLMPDDCPLGGKGYTKVIYIQYCILLTFTQTLDRITSDSLTTKNPEIPITPKSPLGRCGPPEALDSPAGVHLDPGQETLIQSLTGNNILIFNYIENGQTN